MHIKISLLILTALIVLTSSVYAEPVCEFENTGHRRISGDNPNDFRCIKLRAEAGEAEFQYRLGLIQIGQLHGPKNVTEGLAILKKLAARNIELSADAMRVIGETYKKSAPPLQNYELAYQWLYLASQKHPFKGGAFPLPDAELNLVITPHRMRELEHNAQSVLQNR